MQTNYEKVIPWSSWVKVGESILEIRVTVVLPEDLNMYLGLRLETKNGDQSLTSRGVV